MARKVFTTTISLPKSMAKTLERMRRQEGRTTSELVREALRNYENTVRQRRMTPADWERLSASLKRISAAGKKTNLAAFIARDRLTH